MPSTVQSSLFSGSASKERPLRMPAGPTFDVVTHTIATTSLDEAADRVELVPIPHGTTLLYIMLTCADLDSSGTPALDADIVLSDDGGDTILFNAGAAFQAAQSNVLVLLGTTEVDGDGAQASIDFLVNTAADTAAAGAITLLVGYQGL